jgi:hypothetical protein
MTQEYPYLPAGRSILYVPITNPFMAEAKRVCMKYSTDHNHPTGAVVVKDGMVIGRGANQLYIILGFSIYIKNISASVNGSMLNRALSIGFAPAVPPRRCMLNREQSGMPGKIAVI